MIARTLAALALSCAAGLVACGGAQPAEDDFVPVVVAEAQPSVDVSAEIDRVLGPLCPESAPGAAVLALRDGLPVHMRGYGLSDVAHRTPITQRTLFRLASVTKAFTAMAILVLEHEGRLSVDDLLSRHLPEFTRHRAEWGRLRIRDLLWHVSGIEDYLGLFERLQIEIADSIDNGALVRILEEHKPQEFPPGTRYEYSNSGYVLLAQVVASASGMSYGRFLRERIFAPLGMPHAAVLDDPTLSLPERAIGYARLPESRGWRVDDSNSPIVGDDGVFASLEDFVRWDRAWSTDVLVPEASRREAETSGRLADGTETDYGFGWFVEHDGRLPILRHTGSWVGFRNVMLRSPAEGLTVVVLSNHEDFDPTPVAFAVLAVLRRAATELPVR